MNIALYCILNNRHSEALRRGAGPAEHPSAIKRRMFQFRRSWVTMDLR